MVVTPAQNLLIRHPHSSVAIEPLTTPVHSLKSLTAENNKPRAARFYLITGGDIQSGSIFTSTLHFVFVLHML